VKGIAAGVIGWWAGLDPVMQALLVLMSFDYVSGLFLAVKQRSFCFRRLYMGLFTKSLIYLIVQGTAFVSYSVHGGATVPIPGTELSIPASSVVAAWFCVSEFASLVRNAQNYGVSLPPILAKLAEALQPQKAGVSE
jgi:phage-related holin